MYFVRKYAESSLEHSKDEAIEEAGPFDTAWNAREFAAEEWEEDHWWVVFCPDNKKQEAKNA